MASSLATLRLPAFARLASAYLVNEFGNWLGEVALAIIVFDLTGSPVATAALFIAMQFVPAIGAPPLVGRADALTARRALSLIYLAEAACFVLLAVLPDSEEAMLVPFLLLAALDGSLASTARARSRAAAAALPTKLGIRPWTGFGKAAWPRRVSSSHTHWRICPFSIPVPPFSRPQPPAVRLGSVPRFAGSFVPGPDREEGPRRRCTSGTASRGCWSAQAPMEPPPVQTSPPPIRCWPIPLPRSLADTKGRTVRGGTGCAAATP